MLVGICVVFFATTYWNIKYIVLMKNDIHSARVWYTVACGLVGIAYAIVLGTYFTTAPMQYTLIAGIVLRPVLFFLGCSSLSIAQRRFWLAEREIKALNHIEEAVERI
jgi:hypothetical protein